MARSQEVSRQIARSNSKLARAAQGPAAEAPSVDVAAVVQQVMHSSFGNALVNAALNGADTSALGKALAGEIAASTQGIGAVGPTGAGLAAAGNAAVSRVLSGGTASPQGMSQAAAIGELRGGQGMALPDAVRGRMEKAFGRSFAHVRVHVGDRSAAAADALGAQAVAVGSHIHFAAGQFAPGTPQGDAVIAHELTHVVQADEGRLPGRGGVSDPSMAAEQEAYGNESMAAAVAPLMAAMAVDGAGGQASEGASMGSSPSVGLGSAGAGFGLGTPSFSGFDAVQFASSIDTQIAPSSLVAPGMGMGMGMLPSLGLSGGLGMGGGFGLGGGLGAASAMAPMGSFAVGPMAAAPMSAGTSAPAMMRENPTAMEAARETDSEAAIRQELAMGMNLGFRRSVDASKNTAAVAKEGTGRIDGVFTAPAKSGHLAVEEYMKVMKDVGPDGQRQRSRSDDNIRDSALHTQTANDGHAHLDGDHRLGARPETSATPPGGDPVMGGPGGEMRKTGEAGPGKGSPVRASPGKPKL